MSRTEDLNNVLSDLQSSSGDIEACAVVSEDGLIIASSLPQTIQENQVAAMSAAILSMGARTASELKRGKLEQLFIEGDQGYMVVTQAGEYASLLALAKKRAKLGLLFLDVSRAAEQIKNII